MHFLKTLFNRSATTNHRTLNKRSKTLSLESLEQRIALDASGVRPQLEPVREVHIDNSLVGPDPVVFGKSELVGRGTKSFVITGVAAGSTVEKLDASTNQWRDVSTPPTSSNPRQLLQLLQNRLIQEGDQVRWIPKSTDGVTQKAFEIIGWNDGSETTTPNGPNMPGPVENLAMNIVGDKVQVTWDPPTSGAAVTHYRVHQNPTTVVPSTQTSHTFAKVASPASYAVTIHANSTEGAGEAMTVTLSTGSYQKINGAFVDPILDRFGRILDYHGPNLQHGANLREAVLTNARLPDAYLHSAILDGADLRHASLTGADLTWTSWYKANLTNADLTDAILTNAYLKDVNLNGANLTNAQLIGVRSGGITGFSYKLPQDWQLLNGYLVGPGANLREADLTDINLSDVDLTGVQSGYIVGAPAGLPDDWKLVDGYLVGPGTNLSSAHLDGAYLADTDLTNADLTDANLTDAELKFALLMDANLTNANLTNANLLNATLTNANLTNVNLTNADLLGAYLRTAKLTGANLDNADMSGALLSGAGEPGAGVRSGGITGVPLPAASRLETG